MSKFIPILLFAACASLGSAVAAADADPSMHEVWQAAENGHVDQAQSMMVQVLKDHPDSAKAHFVEAELDAKQQDNQPSQEILVAVQLHRRLTPFLSYRKQTVAV